MHAVTILLLAYGLPALSLAAILIALALCLTNGG